MRHCHVVHKASHLVSLIKQDRIWFLKYVTQFGGHCFCAKIECVQLKINSYG